MKKITVGSVEKILCQIKRTLAEDQIALPFVDANDIKCALVRTRGNSDEAYNLIRIGNIDHNNSQTKAITALYCEVLDLNNRIKSLEDFLMDKFDFEDSDDDLRS